MIDDLDNRGEADLDDLAISALDFYARRGQGLGSLHTADDAADAITIFSYDLNVAFAVKRLQRRQGPGYFHLVAFVSDLNRLTITGRAGFVNSATALSVRSPTVREGLDMRPILNPGPS